MAGRALLNRPPDADRGLDIMLNRILFNISLIGCFCVLGFGQNESSDLITDLQKVVLFKTNRERVESVFKPISSKQSKSGKNTFTVYYDLPEARLTVIYSLGRCSDRSTNTGYDVVKDVVVGSILDLNRPRPIRDLPFEISKFKRYLNSEGNYVIWTDEESGLKLTGGDDNVSGIDVFPSKAEFVRYSCVQKSP